jgi:hypothetical protein
MLRWLFSFLLVLTLGGGARVYAHDEVTLGDYVLEYGWVEEPPAAGTANAFVLTISEGGHTEGEEAGHEHTEVDVSGLTVEVSYGGETTALTLKPADEAGHFTADFTPERPGKYTLKVSGTLDGKLVNAEVEPEEVEPSGMVASDSGGSSLAIILALVAVAISLGTVFAVRLSKKKA